MTGPPPKCFTYFQPDCLSQAASSAGWIFSQAVIDRVSLDDSLSFMHEHQAAATSAPAPYLLVVTDAPLNPGGVGPHRPAPA
jgi:hypothetical protein